MAQLNEQVLQMLKDNGYTKKEIDILREQKAKKFYIAPAPKKVGKMQQHRRAMQWITRPKV